MVLAHRTVDGATLVGPHKERERDETVAASHIGAKEERVGLGGTEETISKRVRQLVLHNGVEKNCSRIVEDMERH